MAVTSKRPHPIRKGRGSCGQTRRGSARPQLYSAPSCRGTPIVREGALPKSDSKRLVQIQVELDQCWDLLRQRRALRDVGLDPDEAEVRPPQVVENYEQ